MVEPLFPSINMTDATMSHRQEINEMEHHKLAVQRMQLISPPPEEILSLKWASGSINKTQTGIVSKRKRVPLTPPKPAIGHTTPAKRKKKVVPIPPYEPPRDIFTPPREVFLNSVPTRSAPKRKSSVSRQTRARSKGKDLRVNTILRVKQEIPDDIDLLAPMPPPSPTDDPLLLSGPPETEPETEPMSGLQDGETSSTWQELWGRPLSSSPTMETLALTGDEDEAEEEEVQRLSIEPASDKFDNEDLQNAMQSTAIDEDTSFLEDAPASEDDESIDSTDELGLVKITSADPRAAARAVALLKQHDYDCYTKLTKKRRASHSALVDFTKECRRKEVTTSGIVKTTDRRRRTTMGVIGDRVIIPGSPITTLPDLLQQAEEEILQSNTQSPRTSVVSPPSRDPFNTPISIKFANNEGLRVSMTPERYPAGLREWTKEDWKLLDACFTDQRINLEDSHVILAPVDTVALQDVVARFINLIGGQSLVDTFGESWSRDNLLERSRALQKKQRSGSVAPPTTPIPSLAPRLVSPTHSNAAGFLHSGMDVPDFTPIRLGHREVPDILTRHRSIQRTSEIDKPLFLEKRQTSGLPSTLLAPRYSHLLEEARAVKDGGPSSDHLEDEVTASGEVQNSNILLDDSLDSIETHTELSRNSSPCSADEELYRRCPDSVTNNFGNRFRGFFSSYLPMLSRPSTSKKIRVQEQRCLPLPPLSVLEKPRGPVETPARPSVPRPPHPKDLVHLNHISLPPSNIPRAKTLPKRLVELVPVSQTAIKPERTLRDGLVPRPRRSSGSSVKDLVSGFEQMEKPADRRFGVGNIRVLKQGPRPIWKP